MFEYMENSLQSDFYVLLPNRLEFNIEFLEKISEMREKILNTKCKSIKVTKSDQYPQYPKICLTYLICILRSCGVEGKSILYSEKLYKKILNIHREDGRQFVGMEEVEDYITSETGRYYVFESDDDLDKPIQNIAEILVNKSVTLNSSALKEFLKTTIGEIFSNCFNHSDSEKAYFICDIQKILNEYYLSVVIFDYGKTIISNVKEHFKNENITDIECMEWAIQLGNTTRNGSGGYGLPTIIDYIENVEGVLYIASGDVYLEYQNGNTNVKHSLAEFKGTNVTFQVKLFNTSKILMYDDTQKKVASISLDSI